MARLGNDVPGDEDDERKDAHVKKVYTQNVIIDADDPDAVRNHNAHWNNLLSSRVKSQLYENAKMPFTNKPNNCNSIIQNKEDGPDEP